MRRDPFFILNCLVLGVAVAGVLGVFLEELDLFEAFALCLLAAIALKTNPH